MYIGGNAGTSRKMRSRRYRRAPSLIDTSSRFRRGWFPAIMLVAFNCCFFRTKWLWIKWTIRCFLALMSFNRKTNLKAYSICNIFYLWIVSHYLGSPMKQYRMHQLNQKKTVVWTIPTTCLLLQLPLKLTLKSPANMAFLYCTDSFNSAASWVIKVSMSPKGDQVCY